MKIVYQNQENLEFNSCGVVFDIIITTLIVQKKFLFFRWYEIKQFHNFYNDTYTKFFIPLVNSKLLEELNKAKIKFLELKRDI